METHTVKETPIIKETSNGMVIVSKSPLTKYLSALGTLNYSDRVPKYLDYTINKKLEYNLKTTKFGPPFTYGSSHNVNIFKLVREILNFITDVDKKHNIKIEFPYLTYVFYNVYLNDWSLNYFKPVTEKQVLGEKIYFNFLGFFYPELAITIKNIDECDEIHKKLDFMEEYCSLYNKRTIHDICIRDPYVYDICSNLEDKDFYDFISQLPSFKSSSGIKYTPSLLRCFYETYEQET